MRIVILNSSARNQNSWGLGVDSKLIEQILREMAIGAHARIDSIDHIDPISFYGSSRKPRMVDVQIHLEIPCRAAMGWAHANIVVVNPEWWNCGAWDWAYAPPNGAVGGFDAFVFKSEHARSLFPEVDTKRAHVIHWRPSPQCVSTSSIAVKQNPGFLYLIGASVNKLKAAQEIVRNWKSEWPPLIIVGTDKICDALHGASLPPNIEFHGAKIPAECNELQKTYKYHIVASAAEGFGHTFAEAASVGAIPIWTDIPTYNEYYKDIVGNVGCIHTNTETPDTTYKMSPVTSFSGIETAIVSVLSLSKHDMDRISGALKHYASTRVKEFRRLWRSLFQTIIRNCASKTLVSLPPRLIPVEDLPHVAIITLTRNRPQWWGNMVNNILKCDYPPDKFSWIIADDSDGMGRVDENVVKFQSMHPRINVKYLSIPHRLHIGEKRNKAIAHAPKEASVFVMMDDDDHYPSVSVAARVAWLKTLGVGCVYCSTIPMYDCKRYISAINVPPLYLSPIERVSEATLCFTREFFSARGFPAAVDMAEGEGFLVDRLDTAAEIPPEGIIVSFIHGGNASSRRVPESSEPNGCHYGFDDEFFTYISKCSV